MFSHFLTEDSEGDCGKVHATVAQARECQGEYDDMQWQMELERDMERRTERFYEEGTEAQQMQYRWEVEMDEANAAFWSGALV